MHIDTENVIALEQLREAQNYISLYQQSKEYRRLKEAKTSLEKALEKDNNYLRARFWKGLVNDLLGEFREAVGDLQSVKDAFTSFELSPLNQQKQKHFFLLVDYNLGIAKYHHYQRKDVEEAIKHLKNAINQFANEKDRLLAKAWLAKAHAVRMIPSPPRKPGRKAYYEGKADFQNVTDYFKSDELKNNAEDFFKFSKEEYDDIINKVDSIKRELGDKANEILGLGYEAKAVALMFYTDFHDKDRIKKLEEALLALGKANEFMPNDWSVHCNFASVNMRLGCWQKKIAKKSEGRDRKTLELQSAENFKKAHNYLDKVINDLRPRYGFALYEKGRAYRLNGDFDEANKKFDEALEIPKEKRDVSDSRLKFEKERANRELLTFP